MDNPLIGKIYNMTKISNEDAKVFYLKNYPKTTKDRSPDPNKIGAPLERFSKAMFCGFSPLDGTDLHHNEIVHNGGTNNPPDYVLKEPLTAVEVKQSRISSKKSCSFSSELNSSPPYNKMCIDKTKAKPDFDILLKEHERDCIDVIYQLGGVLDDRVVRDVCIYGDCFADDIRLFWDQYVVKLGNKLLGAGEEIKKEGYNTPKDHKDGNELYRIDNIDRLGRTWLRVRGMWMYEFKKYLVEDVGINFKAENMNKYYSYNIISKKMYNNLSNSDKEWLNESNIEKKDIQITNPVCSKFNEENYKDIVLLKLEI